MSDVAQDFISDLNLLAKNNRAAMAHLKRSLSFDPGTYPPVFPYVERFVGTDCNAGDPWRQALYLTAALYARHPDHQEGVRIAAAIGNAGYARKSSSIEKRFIALLAADQDSLPTHLRQIVSLLASDGLGFDYVILLDDLGRWFNPYDVEKLHVLRQRWAREFYRYFDPYTPKAILPLDEIKS